MSAEHVVEFIGEGVQTDGLLGIVNGCDRFVVVG